MSDTIELHGFERESRRGEKEEVERRKSREREDEVYDGDKTEEVDPAGM